MSSLNNAETSLMKCDISFYYDRYRFDNVGDGATGLTGTTTYIDNSRNALSDYVNSIRATNDVFGSVEYE